MAEKTDMNLPGDLPEDVRLQMNCMTSILKGVAAGKERELRELEAASPVFVFDVPFFDYVEGASDVLDMGIFQAASYVDKLEGLIGPEQKLDYSLPHIIDTLQGIMDNFGIYDVLNSQVLENIDSNLEMCLGLEKKKFQLKRDYISSSSDDSISTRAENILNRFKEDASEMFEFIQDGIFGDEYNIVQDSLDSGFFLPDDYIRIGHVMELAEARISAVNKFLNSALFYHEDADNPSLENVYNPDLENTQAFLKHAEKRIDIDRKQIDEIGTEMRDFDSSNILTNFQRVKIRMNSYFDNLPLLGLITAGNLDYSNEILGKAEALMEQKPWLKRKDLGYNKKYEIYVEAIESVNQFPKPINEQGGLLNKFYAMVQEIPDTMKCNGACLAQARKKVGEADGFLKQNSQILPWLKGTEMFTVYQQKREEVGRMRDESKFAD